MSAAPEIAKLSRELLDLLGAGRQIAPITERWPGFGLAEAYQTVAALRELRVARGETPIGRKIGFTNRAIWGELGISAPIWNYVFDTTVSEAAGGRADAPLAGMTEPRIEPEIVLHLAVAPSPGMNVEEILGCVDWVAPAFEIVFSIFPGWRFSAAEAAAAYGVHGALILGERLALAGATAESLRSFTVEIENGAGIRREGHATHVLGGPLEALQFLIEEIARHPGSEPLAAGEIVTTGTLTEAMPLIAGETWSVRFDGIDLGIDLEPMELSLT